MSLIEPLHPDTHTNIDIHIKALHTGNSVCDGLLTDPAEKYNKNSNVKGLETGREIRACGTSLTQVLQRVESPVCKSAWCNRWRRANLFAATETPRYPFLLSLKLTQGCSNHTNLCHKQSKCWYYYAAVIWVTVRTRL